MQYSPHLLLCGARVLIGANLKIINAIIAMWRCFCVRILTWWNDLFFFPLLNKSF